MRTGAAGRTLSRNLPFTQEKPFQCYRKLW